MLLTSHEPPKNPAVTWPKPPSPRLAAPSSDRLRGLEEALRL